MCKVLGGRWVNMEETSELSAKYNKGQDTRSNIYDAESCLAAHSIS